MNPSDDRSVAGAFARARSLEPTDGEVETVLRRVADGRRAARRRRRVAAVAAAGALLVAGAAAAADRLLSVGDVIPLSREPQSDGLRYTSDRTVVATGRAPVAGRWQMTVAETDAGFCFGLELPDAEPGAMNEGCGGASRAFAAGSVGGGDVLPNSRLVHGPVPEAAAAVRITAPNGYTQSEATHEGPDEIPSDFYLVEMPLRVQNAHLTWLDDHGSPRGSIPVPGTGG
jgi:hypothetical protein